MMEYSKKRQSCSSTIPNKRLKMKKQIKEYLQYVTLYVNFISEHKNVRIIMRDHTPKYMKWTSE